MYQLSPRFGVRVPTGRAISPITGTNWEGVGVTPDVAVPAAAALDTAHRAALQQVLAHLRENPPPMVGGPSLLDEVQEALAAYEAAPA
jgi:hypothetical protein